MTARTRTRSAVNTTTNVTFSAFRKLIGLVFLVIVLTCLTIVAITGTVIALFQMLY